MVTTVTLQVFSGRPNPHVVLSSEAEEELTKRLRRLSKVVRQRVQDRRPFGIGVLRATRSNRSQMLCDGALVELTAYPFSYADSEKIYDLLLGAFPDSVVPRALKRRMKALAGSTPLAFTTKGSYKRCKPNPAVDARPFDLNWGTVGYNHQPCNNCYDYANDQITDTFSQPGYGSGQIFTAHTAAAIGDAAVRDGLVRVPNLTDPLKKPGSGWYVALLLGSVPGTGPKREFDYHWLRQNKEGCWSHKLGSGSVWNTDSTGKPIYDPLSATYNWGGVVYNKFGGFFRTNSTVTIKGVGLTSWCYDWGW
jgi:hypothetical protein